MRAQDQRDQALAKPCGMRDPLKRFPMYSAVAAEESAFPVGRAQDPRDPFDIALEEYQAVPDSTLTIHQSKHGNFMGPSTWA